MRTNELLAAIIWQNGISIAINVAMLHELRKLNQGVSHLATDEQVAALTAEVDALEKTEEVELGAINDKIAALVASQGNQPDPRVDEQIARLTVVRNKIAGTVEGGAEPDAPSGGDTPPA